MSHSKEFEELINSSFFHWGLVPIVCPSRLSDINSGETWTWRPKLMRPASDPCAPIQIMSSQIDWRWRRSADGSSLDLFCNPSLRIVGCYSDNSPDQFSIQVATRISQVGLMDESQNDECHSDRRSDNFLSSSILGAPRFEFAREIDVSIFNMKSPDGDPSICQIDCGCADHLERWKLLVNTIDPTALLSLAFFAEPMLDSRPW